MNATVMNMCTKNCKLGEIWTFTLSKYRSSIILWKLIRISIG